MIEIIIMIGVIGWFAKTAKTWMDAFLKRLHRVSPSATGFWRIEWKARKSGAADPRVKHRYHGKVLRPG